MKKKLFITIAVIISSITLYSQVNEPVSTNETNIQNAVQIPDEPAKQNSNPATVNENKATQNTATVNDNTNDNVSATNNVTTNEEIAPSTTTHTTPVDTSDLKNIDVRTTPVVTTGGSSASATNYGNPENYFVRDLKLKNITKNEIHLQIFDRYNKPTLGHFAIIRETETRNSFNNTILTDAYYVTDNALEPIAGRASQREVGFLSVYYSRYQMSLGGTISTAIIDFLVLGAGAALLATSLILYDQNHGINNLNNDPLGKLYDAGYLPFFIGGIAAMSYAAIFSIVVIVNAAFTGRYYSNYDQLKKNIINTLNKVQAPISIKDKDGDTVAKIGFDLRINPISF